MQGTIRTLDARMREDIAMRFKRTVQDIATSAGATADLSIEKRTLIVFNDSALVSTTLPALQAAAGKENVQLCSWSALAEDYSFYGTVAPAFYFYLGGMPKGNDPTKAPAHHTADFFIDESGFDVGVKAFCQLVLNYPTRKK